MIYDTYIYTHMHIHIYIYVFIHRERCLICNYMYMYMYMFYTQALSLCTVLRRPAFKIMIEGLVFNFLWLVE